LESLRHSIEEALSLTRPSQQTQVLTRLAGPIYRFLESAALANARSVYRQAVTMLCASENETLLTSLLGVLRDASASTAAVPVTLDLLPIVRRCERVLQLRLSVAARDAGDWSIAAPESCACNRCDKLARFLGAADRRQLEWPLAKDARRHIHQMLDSHELPVDHEARRSGRPYTLVLTKTSALFEREAADRRTWQADLAWLRRVWR